MLKIVILCVLATNAIGSYIQYQPYQYQPYQYQPAPAPTPAKVVKVEPPKPYEFKYNIKDQDGNTQARQESGDAQGNMKGSYEITSIDGLRRWLQYVADGAGFRAVIQTNEPGTDNQNPADVEIKVDAAPAPVKKVEKVIVKSVEPEYKLIKVPVRHGGYTPYHYGHHGPYAGVY
ncbi:Uncharacterised protein g1287 [Pycnogonum litorale]